MFKSMRIEINEEQPLVDVVRELERLGYRWGNDVNHKKPTKYIITFNDGIFDYFHGGCRWYDLTTFAELKGTDDV